MAQNLSAIAATPAAVLRAHNSSAQKIEEESLQ
jgi:hypothetical protein